MPSRITQSPLIIALMKAESSLDKCLKNDNCSFNKDFKLEAINILSVFILSLLSSINLIKFLKFDGCQSDTFSTFIILIISPPNFFSFLIKFFIDFFIFFIFSFSISSFGTNCLSNIEIPVSLFTSIIKGFLPNNSQNNLIR